MIYRTTVLAFLTQQHKRSASQQIITRLMMISSSPSLPQHPVPPVFQSITKAQEYIISTEGTKKTTRCGELKCQHDSMLSTFKSAHILSYAQFIPAQPKKNKKKKKSSSSVTSSNDSKNSEQSNYLIVLSDSIFFPEGGGQPPDSGEIVIEKPSNHNETDGTMSIHLQVVDAQNIKGTCVLTCNTKDSNAKVQSILTAVSTSEDSIDIDSGGDHGRFRVIQKLNWDKRLEYMTSHSAQHLISAVALGDYGLNTQSFSLRADSLVSYIDFSWDNENDFKSIFVEVEEKVNDHIQSNLSVSPTWIEAESKKSKEEENVLRSRLLPKDMEGKMRLVSISGVDLNTCCGTHVKSLGQLQMIKFLRVETFKSNVIRVHFASGKRLMKLLKSYNDQSMTLVNMLSCTEQETVERVQNLLEEKKERERHVKDLKEKLCQSQAKEIIQELKGNGNLAVIDLGYGIDMGFMTLLSSTVTESCTEEEAPVLLFVGRPDTSLSVEEGSFLLTGPRNFVDGIGKEVATILSGRGGGKFGKFQGKVTRLSGLNEVRDLLKAKMNT
mmetsp:Transcript_21866/g.32726  ORF Transcript_21866/g.32726 Transcript_21866/m.32726 type:complete len:552 (+) Transcript_21866:114-1769(+)